MAGTNLFHDAIDLLHWVGIDVVFQHLAKSFLIRRHAGRQPKGRAAEIRGSISCVAVEGRTREVFQNERKRGEILFGLWKHPANERIIGERGHKR